MFAVYQIAATYLIHISFKQPCKRVMGLIPFYRRENKGTEKYTIYGQ